MDSIVGKVMRPFTAVWRVIALTLVICATGGAWADLVAEWGPGNFPVSAAGSYDNMTATSGDYTISKNNGYNISTANYIQVAPSSVGGGWPVVISSTDLSALTVVVAFSLDEDASGSLVGLTTGRGANRFYAYLEDGAMYAGYDNGNSNKYGDLSTTVPTDGTIHYLVFAYGKTAGTQMFYDGVSKYNASGLKEGDSGGNSGNTSEITFGAQRGPQQIINGVKFHYVAVYDSKLGNTDALAAYSSAKSKVDALVKYEKWSYAKALLTWTTSGNYELASSSAKYTLFDIDSGSDTETVYNGAGTSYQLFGASASEVFWHYICDSGVGTVYSAPGVALRFSGDTAGKTIGGTFGPVAFGGIYVESGATGYSFTQTSGSKRDNIWGDPSNTVETWFTFEEPFEVNRAGSFFFAGTVNLDLPESGDVLTLQKNSTYTDNEGHNPVIVKTYTQQGNGVALSVNNATLGGTLKMHGAGHMDVTTLTANGAILDFSDIGSRYNDTTPFVNGELVVNADTKFVFPDGISYPYTYKVAASISDGSTIPTTFTVDGNVYTGVVSADKANGTITIASLLSATAIEVNNDLTISGATAANITVNAGKTLTLESGAALTGTVTGSGTVVCNQVDLSGSGFDNASGWTGKVQIAGDANMPTTYFDESSYGNANSTLEIASGHVAITAATALPGTVNVASGATLYMTSSSLTSLAISGTNNGMVNLQAAAALATLSLDNGIARGTGSISYPSTLTTLNLTLKENLADDTEIVFSVGNGTTLTAATVTMYGPDGSTVNNTAAAAVSEDGHSVTVTYTPTVSGNACWIDYEMDYESGVKTGFENTGTDTTNLSSDTISGPNTPITGSDAFTDHGMLYTYAHPYRTGLGTLPDNWTAVVRCTVPNYSNAAVITFGWYDSMIGLVAGPNPETDMLLIKTTGDSQFETLATMKVEDATTAQHVYIFSVENGETIKVYCDGRQVLNRTFDPFTLTSGFQVGSALGGVHNTGVVRFGKNESPANTLDETVQKNARIDCVRLYKSVLGANAIRQLSAEFPSVELYKATIAADATTTWGDLAWENDKTWSGGNIYSKIILTVEGDASLTLPSTITAEDFQINVASDHVLTLNRPAGGTTITTTNPMEINNGTMYLADDTSLGTWEIAGTGTVRLIDGAAVTGALSGNAKVEIPSGTTVAVVGSGSIANTITGAGVLTYQYASGLPGALTLGDWTGTVILPGISSGIGVNLNNYGKLGSKVQVSGLSSGTWLENATINPEVNLAGDMTLTAFSATFANTFNKLSGSRAFSLTAEGTAQEYVDGYFLIKDVSDFTGSITVAAPGLALGGTSKPSSTTWCGNIVVQAPVTVGSGATWSADGVVLADTSATLTVPDGATVPAVSCGVAGYEVKRDTTTTPGSTVYSLLKRGTIFSVY